eukprot:scaffold231690_cov19-Tisochrysis_lutea.AAC.2
MQVMPVPANYQPIIDPAKKLMATPTPSMTPFYSIPEESNQLRKDMPEAPEGLPEMKPEDMQTDVRCLVGCWCCPAAAAAAAATRALGAHKDMPESTGAAASDETCGCAVLGKGAACGFGCGCVWGAAVACCVGLVMDGHLKKRCAAAPLGWRAGPDGWHASVVVYSALVPQHLLPPKDVDEAELSLEEAKERKIMKLLLKVKNGTPPQRKAALRHLTDKARDLGAGPLFNQILPLLGLHLLFPFAGNAKLRAVCIIPSMATSRGADVPCCHVVACMSASGPPLHPTVLVLAASLEQPAVLVLAASGSVELWEAAVAPVLVLVLLASLRQPACQDPPQELNTRYG